jgi:hypothetical protein
MSYFRSLSATVLSAAATFSLVTASCGTSAVGVDDCRDIEQARCRAGASCLDSKGHPLIDDVPACERYYRDHCLHGLLTKPPSRASVSACVEVIEGAGRCASADPDSALVDCAETVPAPQRNLTRACDVFAHPELATECAFLTDEPNDGAAGQGAGGQSSTDDTSSGASAGQPSAGAAPGGASSE